MGKNKRGGSKVAAGGVFKVAGAKSLKKNKSKAVQLGLKNIKKKVEEVDAQFVALSKQPGSKAEPKKVDSARATAAAPRTPSTLGASASADAKEETRRQITDTVEKLVQMDV